MSCTRHAIRRMEVQLLADLADRDHQAFLRVLRRLTEQVAGNGTDS